MRICYNNAYILLKIRFFIIMNIQLSDHFTFKKLFRFTLPTVAMTIFSSIYIIIDGFFVSNFAGSTAFAAVNIVMPVLMIFTSVGFMVGTGGNALVAMTLGQGDKKRANEIFSLLVYFLIAMGVILDIIGYIFIEDIVIKLGATPEMLPLCLQYARISLISLIPYMLQNLFQSFMITAERPALGFVITLIAGGANIGLDAFLVGGLGMGVSGAATATVISEFLGGVIPLIYFFSRNKTRLRLGATHFYPKAILKTCANGSSELMGFIAASIVNILYNIQLMNYSGEAGVAAYGVLMYFFVLAEGVFMGYSMGVSPIIGYDHGADDRRELSNVFKKSILIICVCSVAITALAELGAPIFAGIFVGYDESLYRLTISAFRIYSVSFILMGLNLFGSSLFTALNNGLISAVISFARTLVFEVLCILLLPRIFGINGIWSSVIVAECGAFILTLTFLIVFRKKYGYSFKG